jgi:hypothetical protein
VTRHAAWPRVERYGADQVSARSRGTKQRQGACCHRAWLSVFVSRLGIRKQFTHVTWPSVLWRTRSKTKRRLPITGRTFSISGGLLWRLGLNMSEVSEHHRGSCCYEGGLEMFTNKRPRGRPRKPDQFDWLRDPPEWIRQAFPIGNIDEASHQDYKKLCEESRREKVSASVCATYRSGGNTANANRQNSKQQRRKNITIENEALIFNLSFSSSAVAGLIKKQGKNQGLSERTLRDYVSSIRKSWQGQIGKKIG